MKNDFQFTLIRAGKLYSPEEKETKNLLLAGDRIARIAECINVPKGLGVEIVDASGKLVAPGFIDLHVHLIDGGGELIGMAIGDVSSLGKVLKNLVDSNVLSLSDALKLFTSNPTDRLGIADQEGEIRDGSRCRSRHSR